MRYQAALCPDQGLAAISLGFSHPSRKARFALGAPPGCLYGPAEHDQPGGVFSTYSVRASKHDAFQHNDGNGSHLSGGFQSAGHGELVGDYCWRADLVDRPGLGFAGLLADYGCNRVLGWALGLGPLLNLAQQR